MFIGFWLRNGISLSLNYEMQYLQPKLDNSKTSLVFPNLVIRKRIVKFTNIKRFDKQVVNRYS